MTRLMRVVALDDWPVSDALGDRAHRLREAPGPALLLNQVIAEAMEAAELAQVVLRWQPSDDSTGFYRLVAQIPL